MLYVSSIAFVCMFRSNPVIVSVCIAVVVFCFLHCLVYLCQFHFSTCSKAVTEYFVFLFPGTMHRKPLTSCVPFYHLITCFCPLQNVLKVCRFLPPAVWRDLIIVTSVLISKCVKGMWLLSPHCSVTAPMYAAS